MKILKKYQSPVPSVPSKVWQDPVYFFAFGFGSGVIPFAPGTFGTLMAIPFYLLVQSFALPYYLLFVLFFIILASLACDKVSREIGLHDHQGMCIDEFAGFFVTMIHVPATFGFILLGFLLFRFFDIVKPWPINLMDENIHGGFGMVIDDVMAGVYSCLVLQVILYCIR